MSTAVDVLLAGVSQADVVDAMMKKLGFPTDPTPTDREGAWLSYLLDMDVTVWVHERADDVSDDIAYRRYPVCVQFKRWAGRHLLAHHQIRVMLPVARAVGSFLAREFGAEAMIVFDLQQKLATIDSAGTVTELVSDDDAIERAWGER